MNRPICSRAGVLVTLVLIASQPLSAQVPAAADEALGSKIERMFIDAYPDADGPGAAILVVDDGEVVYRGARGMANVELSVPLSADHVFRLGSITKVGNTME